MSTPIDITDLGPDDQLILFTDDESPDRVRHLAEGLRTQPTLILAGGTVHAIIRRGALRRDRP